MWHSLVLLVVLMAVSCSPEGEGDVTGSTNKCAVEAVPSYNPKVLDQCIAACIKCDSGTRATCSTSCTFKGAR